MKMIRPKAASLLQRVKRHILEKPNRFLMRTFIARATETKTKTFEDDNGKQQKYAECGTAACIAGWAVLLHDGREDRSQVNIRERAIELLDLERGAEDKLFEVGYWPHDLYLDYRSAKTQRQRAEIAGKVIDRFIDKHTDVPIPKLSLSVPEA